MAERGTAGRVVFLAGTWGRCDDEPAFAARGMAAAVSRHCPVEVLVPGPPGASRPDGAFDLAPVGGEPAGTGDLAPRWPAPAEARWAPDGPALLVVVDDADLGALALADHFLPGVPVAPVVSWGRSGGDAGAHGHHGPLLAVGVGDTDAGGDDEGTDAVGDTDAGGDTGGHGAQQVGLHVPVHALAAQRRHVGIGFSDYLLVLGDRGPEAAGDDDPTPLARWLATRFADRHLVVVENATATVWRSRSLRGRTSVDTRVDLWRLVAHARATVDLAPGPLLARECVESLRYGVPVVVPSGGAGARLAARGGGLWFDDEAGLLGCVEALDDQHVRDALGAQGRAVAEDRYGEPDRFVRRVGRALDAFAACPRSG